MGIHVLEHTNFPAKNEVTPEGTGPTLKWDPLRIHTLVLLLDEVGSLLSPDRLLKTN